MIHNDHLGTPQKMTDSTGAVVWAADYKPFGEATITVSTITNNLRFPGQYFDAETGIHYNYQRDYNPTIGAYYESDHLGVLYGTNHLYVYVNNNPVRYVDPMGLEPKLGIPAIPGTPTGSVNPGVVPNLAGLLKLALQFGQSQVEVNVFNQIYYAVQAKQEEFDPGVSKQYYILLGTNPLRFLGLTQGESSLYAEPDVKAIPFTIHGTGKICYINPYLYTLNSSNPFYKECAKCHTIR